MKNRKFRSGVVLIVGIVGTLLAACTTPSAPAPTPAGRPAVTPSPAAVANKTEKVKIQVTQKSGTYGTLFWFPRAKGYYQEEGIDLELLIIKATLSVPALLAGEIDYVGQVGGPLELGLTGGPIRVLAGFQSRPVWYIFGATGVNTLEDLKGKPVGVSSLGSSAQYAVQVGLKNLGLDPNKDVTYVAIPDPTALFGALKAKTIGAAGLISPNEMLARDAGLKEFLFIGDILEIPLSGISTTTTHVKENPSQARKVIKGTLRGLTYSRDHPDETVQFLMKELGLDEKTARATYQGNLRSWSYDGTIPSKAIENALEQGRTLGSLKKAVTREDIDRVLDLSLLKEAQKELGLAR
ncbi:MAG: ABC transporter substrate-binding protein [Chloroflexi bacterium]|nr:ABC transporter substrate-binding protein [Chloroflexota bacterium]